MATTLDLQILDLGKEIRQTEADAEKNQRNRVEELAAIDTSIGQMKRAQFRSNVPEVEEAIRPFLDEYNRQYADIQTMERAAIEHVREKFKLEYKAAEAEYMKTRDRIKSKMKAEHIQKLEQAQASIVDLEARREKLKQKYDKALIAEGSVINALRKKMHELQVEAVALAQAQKAAPPPVEAQLAQATA